MVDKLNLPFEANNYRRHNRYWLYMMAFLVVAQEKSPII